MSRTVLVHLNIEVPDDDDRSVPELVRAVEGAIEVGSDDEVMKGLECVLAEEVESTIVDSRHSRDEAARKAARGTYAHDECEFDPNARVSHLDEGLGAPDDGGAWVAAWVYVDAAQIESEL